jgi:hypothetical protein
MPENSTKYYNTTIREIYQQTGALMGLTSSSDKNLLIESLKNFEANYVFNWQNIIYPIFTGSKNSPYRKYSGFRSAPWAEYDVLNETYGGASGWTLTAEPWADENSLPALWDEINKQPHSITGALYYLSKKIEDLTSETLAAIEFDDSQLKASIGALENNLETVYKDLYGCNYSMDNDGVKEMQYSVTSHLSAILSKFTNSPTLVSDGSCEPTYPTLEFDVSASEINWDVVIPQSYIEDLVTNLNAIKQFAGMDTLMDSSPGYSTYASLNYISDGDSLEEAIATLDTEVGNIVAGTVTLLSLSDTPSSFGTTGQVLAVDANGTAVEWVTPSGGGGGATTFIGLTDTPGAMGSTDQVINIQNIAGNDVLAFSNFRIEEGNTALYTGGANQGSIGRANCHMQNVFSRFFYVTGQSGAQTNVSDYAKIHVDATAQDRLIFTSTVDNDRHYYQFNASGAGTGIELSLMGNDEAFIIRTDHQNNTAQSYRLPSAIGNDDQVLRLTGKNGSQANLEWVDVDTLVSTPSVDRIEDGTASVVVDGTSNEVNINFGSTLQWKFNNGVLTPEAANSYIGSATKVLDNLYTEGIAIYSGSNSVGAITGDITSGTATNRIDFNTHIKADKSLIFHYGSTDVTDITAGQIRGEDISFDSGDEQRIINQVGSDVWFGGSNDNRSSITTVAMFLTCTERIITVAAQTLSVRGDTTIVDEETITSMSVGTAAEALGEDHGMITQYNPTGLKVNVEESRAAGQKLTLVKTIDLDRNVRGIGTKSFNGNNLCTLLSFYVKTKDLVYSNLNGNRGIRVGVYVSLYDDSTSTWSNVTLNSISTILWTPSGSGEEDTFITVQVDEPSRLFDIKDRYGQLQIAIEGYFIDRSGSTATGFIEVSDPRVHLFSS